VGLSICPAQGSACHQFPFRGSNSLGKSEEILGRASRDFARRDEVVIATKVYGRMRPGANGAGLSRKAIFAEIDASLTRLGVDYIDLYQIHRWDDDAPVEETLHDIVKAGKARYIGASSMRAWQLARALGIAERIVNLTDPRRLSPAPLGLSRAA
jgi:1-deoxyxylulose-5-phosphate synthase